MKINAAQARLELEHGAVLLDVRTPAEYGEGHIPKAVNLPVDRISEVERLVPDRQQTVIVYCRSGVRSAVAAATMEALSWAHVLDLGGIYEWDGALER